MERHFEVNIKQHHADGSCEDVAQLVILAKGGEEDVVELKYIIDEVDSFTSSGFSRTSGTIADYPRRQSIWRAVHQILTLVFEAEKKQ